VRSWAGSWRPFPSQDTTKEELADDEVAVDNEAPSHMVEVPAFWLDAASVSSWRYQKFIEAGGYGDSALVDEG
jgi:formylglycine-generating enzyme required for sulfatase activity